MKTAKKVLAIVASVILWAVILLAALYAFVTLATKNDRDVKSFLGITPMTVSSDSMEPTFTTSDLIIVKKCDTSKLKEGDIITFHTIINNEYALNTHRIAKIDEVNGVRSYTTKGDNNAIEDTHHISDGDIVGKYSFRMVGMGSLMKFLSSKLGFFLIIVLPMLIFFVYQIYHLVMVSMNLKKAMAAESADQNMDEANAKKAEAEAALEEARRIKAEAEALKAEALKIKGEEAPETKENNE